MGEQYKYKTITAPTTGDFRDRGSKFFSFAYAIADVDDAKAKVKALKKQHPKAVHFCVGYRLGTEGTLFRAADDGEPSGSAGRPILGQIDSFGVTNVMVVVVRYFGGSLLGVPGLINAYKMATQLALEQATFEEKWIEQRITISFDYPAMNSVLQLLKQSEATIYRQDLQLFCDIDAGVPVKHAEQYIGQLEKINGVEIKANG